MIALAGDVFSVEKILNPQDSSVAAAAAAGVQSDTGMDVDGPSTTESRHLLVGPGLLQNQTDILAVKSGHLRHSGTKKWWIDNTQKRYTPATGDSVVGTIKAKLGESYVVDLGSAHSATLPYLSFEGATKRNRPQLHVGQLVYARVSLANKDMEAELTCVHAATQKADGFGELRGGFVVRCRSATCRSLLDPENVVLKSLGDAFPFELAVGMNGRVWVHSDTVQHTIVVANAIQQTEAAMRRGDGLEQVKRILATLLYSMEE